MIVTSMCQASVGAVVRSPTFPAPRRIQLTAVDRGISNSGKSSGSPRWMICILDAVVVGAAC